MKKIIAVIMCIAMILTAIPMTAFAADSEETVQPFLEIEFKDGDARDILPGESVELYLIYEMGNNSQCSFDWFVNGGGTGGEYESVGFEEGRKGIRITAKKHGTITVIARMFNGEKELVAKDEVEITVIDKRNVFEKTFEGIVEFFKFGLGYLSLTGIWSLFIGLGIFSGIVELPMDLFNKIFKS